MRSELREGSAVPMTRALGYRITENLTVSAEERAGSFSQSANVRLPLCQSTGKSARNYSVTTGLSFEMFFVSWTQGPPLFPSLVHPSVLRHSESLIEILSLYISLPH